MSNESLEPITEGDFQSWKMGRIINRTSARLDRLHGRPNKINQKVREIFQYKKCPKVIYLFK